jgi:hypothetical protein
MHPHTTCRLVTSMQHNTSLRDPSAASSAMRRGEGSRYKLPGPGCPEGGPSTDNVADVFVFLGSTIICRGLGECSRYFDSLRSGRSEDRIPVGDGGGEIYRIRPDRSWGPPSLLCNGYWVSFPGVKRPGRSVDHPPHLAPRLKKE